MFFLIKANATNADYNSARSHMYSAMYKQSGLESEINTYAKTLDDKYIPKYLNDSGIVAGLVMQAMIKHQIGWKWTFE